MTAHHNGGKGHVRCEKIDKALWPVDIELSLAEVVVVVVIVMVTLMP